jgi:hypothetical protein
MSLEQLATLEAIAPQRVTTNNSNSVSRTKEIIPLTPANRAVWQ